MARATPNFSDDPKPREERHMTDRQPQVHAAPLNAEQTIERLTARLARAEGQLKGLQFAFPGLVIFAVGAFAMQLLKPSAVHTQTVVAETLGERANWSITRFQRPARSDPSCAPDAVSGWIRM
jgi:hypothetical protein